VSRLRRRSRESGERGSALVLALLFLTVCGLTMGALLTYANTSSTATTALRVTRGSDYDVDAAMNGAIAKLRMTGATCTSGTGNGYSPSWTLNNPSKPLRVDCFNQSTTATQRDDVLSVCLNSVSAACPDGSSLLRAEVIFYDTPSWGNSIDVQTWSDQ
jgi:hypothetical protein